MASFFLIFYQGQDETAPGSAGPMFWPPSRLPCPGQGGLEVRFTFTFPGHVVVVSPHLAGSSIDSCLTLLRFGSRAPGVRGRGGWPTGGAGKQQGPFEEHSSPSLPPSGHGFLWHPGCPPARCEPSCPSSLTPEFSGLTAASAPAEASGGH